MKIFKVLFVLLFVKPLVFIGLGLNIINRQNLPTNGPIVLAANHNSHLDTMVLLALFPISMVHKVRPVAAADYFFKNKVSAWLSLNILGIIPIHRSPSKSGRHAVFDECHKALNQGDILIIFPEGSRGEPETMSGLKKGIYHLVNGHQTCPVMPVVMRGLGRALPKGTMMFVPFNCDVVLGMSIAKFENADEFLATMQAEYQQLERACIVTNYE
ncbi:lysophospholipid acyltransferase family protein [Vibrio splendidus]|uniref:Lysophospholipid acyltransferase family protein n=1 Tax=Vibrio splendidus TaxID=29497 RepID=A0ABD5AH48_VIBSP|nr:lysophospholipid acyltransferase family protein [Vibrio splendidus]MDP2492270.1 lysophospholipid acyltransferase family protein [Vibrio splendidus]PMO49703.1 glycerol acyltransferase [Vibrio splendidus]